MEELQKDVETWKKRARDWEKQSKANKRAADELQAIKESQMSEQEKAVARAEAAEEELEQLKAEKAHVEAVQRVSEETGVPAKLLNFCQTEEAMREFAGMFDQNKPTVHAAPAARGSNVVRSGEQAPTNADAFAEYMDGLLH